MNRAATDRDDAEAAGFVRVSIAVRTAARLASVVSALDDPAVELHKLDGIDQARDRQRMDADLLITDRLGDDGEIGAALQDLLVRRQPPVLAIVTTDLAGVKALEAGVTDYVVEPVVPRELRARAMLRARAQAWSTLDYGALRVERSARRVLVDGAEVELRPREYDLLVYFAERPGRVIPREALLEFLWGSSPDWQSINTVTEHVYRLRHRIEADPRNPRWIVTVRGAGYRFDALRRHA